MNEKTSIMLRHWLAALVGAGYCALMCWFSYLAIFYELLIPNKITFCIGLSAISLLALSLMLYSRFQVLTRLVGFCLLPGIFPMVMLYFGEWEMIIPIAATALLVFFLSGAGETSKTIFGVIYLLLYILGSLVYFMIVSFFTPTTQSVVLEADISPSNAYRYEIIQTEDSSGGNVAVCVEPNDRDIHLPLLTFVAEGYERKVLVERPIQSGEHHATWSTASRAEITEQLLTISQDIQLELDQSQLAKLSLPADTESVYLRDLSDAQLALLGVPEENDVLSLNGEVCFRSYIAVLEDYFASSNREIKLFS